MERKKATVNYWLLHSRYESPGVGEPWASNFCSPLLVRVDLSVQETKRGMCAS